MNIKNSLNISIQPQNFKYWLLIIFCFYPYLNFLRLGSDTQPNALIFSFFVLFYNFKNKIPTYYLLTLIVFISAIVMFLSSQMVMGSILSLSNYISVLIVPIAIYFTLLHFKGLSYQFYKLVVYIWLFVGLVQRFVSNTFLSFLLSRNSGLSNGVVELTGRGVVGLTPEPTYYGTTILLFIIVYFLNFYDKKDYKILLALFFQIIILSKSSTSIIVLFFCIFLYFIILLFKSNIKIIFYAIFGFIVSSLSFFLFVPLFNNSRIYKIFTVFTTNPQLIFLDQSISERFNAVYFTVGSLFENLGLPQGFNTYQKYIYLKSTLPEYKMFFLNYSFENYSRILSGYGMAFYELGIFGLAIPILIFIAIKNKLHQKNILFAYILFNLILFTAMSLNNAAILFIIGNMIYLSKTQNNNQENIINDIN
jgi:hypothetical protein